MKNILVFCSAQDVSDIYINPSREFAELIAKNGYALVWGGSDRGLMKLVSSTVQDQGGKIIGVSMAFLENKAKEGADEMIIEKNIAERKATMLKRSDAIVVLVGGLGTLDEFTEMLSLKVLGVHNKPIVILNTAGFYNDLLNQVSKMGKEGFMNRPIQEVVHFANTPIDAINYINRELGESRE